MKNKINNHVFAIVQNVIMNYVEQIVLFQTLMELLHMNVANAK